MKLTQLAFALATLATFSTANPVPEPQLVESAETVKIVDTFQLVIFPSEFRISLAAGPVEPGQKYKANLLTTENNIRQLVEDELIKRCDNDWDNSFGDDGVRVCKDDDNNTDMLIGDIAAIPGITLAAMSQSQDGDQPRIFYNAVFKVTSSA